MSLPVDPRDHVCERASWHREHEDERETVERWRTGDDRADECDESDDGDRCEGRAHAPTEDGAVSAPEIAAHVAGSESSRRDEHQRPEPLHAVVLTEQLDERNPALALPCG
jgi:hypothetical protein